ncbi:replication protein A 70 kDa DNA-binding subunit B [Tanacetum coccineum]
MGREPFSILLKRRILTTAARPYGSTTTKAQNQDDWYATLAPKVHLSVKPLVTTNEQPNVEATHKDEAMIIKSHRKHGWAYLACKKCGNIAKQTDAEGINWWNCKLHGRITAGGVVIMYRLIVRVMDDTGSASFLLFDDLVFKLSSIESYTLINQYGEHCDGYFPVELNRIVGKKLLFRFQYNDLDISVNNHVYQVQKI